MDYYGYQQPSYGGNPQMGGIGGPMMAPYGQMHPQGQIYPPGGYGQAFQGGYQGMAPNTYCMKCQGTGYRVSKKGKTKKCKCIKEQEKRMGKYYGYSSSDSD